MNFTAPWAGLLALAAIPVVVVYFLKLRRPRRTVPSLVLWQKVLEDQRVNSPFQRFRRNLLLWLQLLLLACVVLACMQPFVSGGGGGDALPIIVDVSASMATRETEGGPSRLDRVKEELLELVDGLSGGKRVAIIASGTRATQLTDFTADRNVLREAVNRLQIEPVETNLTPALRLADGLTQSTTISELRLYSDGNLPGDPNSPPGIAVVPFDLPFQVDFRRVSDEGQPPVNMGIVEASATRSGESRWEVFVRVTAANEPGRSDVVIEQDGTELRRDAVVLEPGTTQRLAFTIGSSSASTMVVRLEPKQFDGLELDNRVRLDLPAARPLAVQVADSLPAFRFAAEGLANRRFVDAGADLLITGDEGTAAVNLIAGNVPEDLAELVETKPGHTDVVDWQRSDPLLRHVQMSDIQFVEHPAYRDGVGRKDIEEAGYRVVAELSDGPLIVRREDGRTLDYVFLFDPDRSTLPFRIGFPVMIVNAADIATARAELADVRGVTAGVLPALMVDQVGEYTVKRPSGKTQTVRADDAMVLRGIVVDELGDYVIQHDGSDVRNFGVSLLSAVESSLKGVEEVRFSDVTVEATEDAVPESDQSLWRWLAAIGLAVLLFEWWYAHRPAVPRSSSRSTTDRPRSSGRPTPPVTTA